MIHVRPSVRGFTFCIHSRAIRTGPNSIKFRELHVAFKRFNNHSQRRLLDGNTKQTARPLLNIRHCSYQRTMCRGHAENVGTAVVTKTRQVLPTNVKPVHYDLTLEPNFNDFTYEGTVIIE